MIEADKLYEQALALRARATPRPWNAKVFISPPDSAYITDSDCLLLIGAGRKISVEDCTLIVAAINLLDALPALKAKWEREARRAALAKFDAAFAHILEYWNGNHNERAMSNALEHILDQVETLREDIAALQQPAAQAEEE